MSRQDLNQTHSIHLVSPYQFALYWQAHQEGLAVCLNGDAPMAAVPGASDLTTALQLLLLSEHVTLVGPDNEEERVTRQAHHLPTSNMSALENLGVVQFIPRASVQTWYDPGSLNSLKDVYRIHSEFIDEHEPFILAELSASGAHFPWYLLRLYLAACTGNSTRISLIEP